MNGELLQLIEEEARVDAQTKHVRESSHGYELAPDEIIIPLTTKHRLRSFAFRSFIGLMEKKVTEAKEESKTFDRNTIECDVGREEQLRDGSGGAGVRRIQLVSLRAKLEKNNDQIERAIEEGLTIGTLVTLTFLENKTIER